MIRFNVRDYTFPTLREAEEVLDSLREQYESFGELTVADFKTIAGNDDIREEDYSYGWVDVDLDGADVDEDGGWFIDLPSPVHI